MNKSQKNILTSKLLKKPFTKEILTNKFTLNLSNINIFNVCSPNFALLNNNNINDPKYFNQINSYYMKKKKDKNINNNIPQSARLIKKKNPLIKLVNNRADISISNSSDSKKNINKSQNNIKANQKLHLNVSKLNKYKNNKGASSSRNIKLKDKKNITIPSLTLNFKK